MTWALRCVHESQMHEQNCMLNLTYNDENIPWRGMLDHKHFQDFMKRLRFHHRKKIRYYMCGEYGDLNGRPHFHACLFGTDFADKYQWRKNHQGDWLYRSPQLEQLWKLGNAEIGAVTLQSAGYIARYVLKKMTGEKALDHYARTDPASGELYSLPPEYNRMSLRPGIGATWFEQYGHTDVYNSEKSYVVHEGRKHQPPRYYHQLLERKNPGLARKVTRAKQDFAAARGAPTRRALAADEAITKARVQLLKRNQI